VVALHYLEYTRERIASTVLLFFWLLTISAQAIKVHTLVTLDVHKSDISGFVLFVTSFALSVVMFALENVPRPKSEYMLLDEDEVRRNEKS
jgi:ATP-binding cassette, subfamily C (CFTR/MRP), member 1